MDYSTLPKYPTTQQHDLSNNRDDDGPSLGPRAHRIVLDLILVAAIAVLLFQLRRITWAIERPDLERNLDRVYAALSHRHDYEHLGLWCGLQKKVATAPEVATIREALSDAQGRSQAWCVEGHDNLRLTFVDQPHQPWHLIRWFRLHNPTDASRWIGIGVFDNYNTGRTNSLIIYRVAIGFQPSPA